MMQTSVQKPLLTALTPTAHNRLQRQCACGDSSPAHDQEERRRKSDDTLQRTAANSKPFEGIPPIVHHVLASTGQPLERETRAFMEPRFGYDFSRVRVHTDEAAARSAQEVNALAYTVGPHVVFGAGQYAPATAEGHKLLAHELTHTVQQGMQAPALSRLRISNPVDPTEREAERASAAVNLGRSFRPWFSSGPQIARQLPETPRPIDLTNPYETPESRRAEEFAVMTLSVIKDPILEALRRHDSVDFLNRLRAVDHDDRRRLLADLPFMDEIRRNFHGLALWTVILILHFGNTRPENVRRLYLAVSERNFRLVKDLIRAYPELRSEVQTPGTREMLNYELRGTPDHDETLRLMDQRETSRSIRSTSYTEAHYETREGFFNELFGASELRQFTGYTTYDLVRAGNELRVIVRIRFVQGATNETYYPSDAKANEWRGGIERVWNKPFYAWNGTTQLTIVFVPIFNASNPNITVHVLPGSDRSDETHWHEEDDANTAAHEFGHMLGNPDEYRLPARASEIPASLGVRPEDVSRTNVEDINRTTGRTVAPVSSDTTLPGIMGAGSGSADKRHIQPILDFYNQTTKPADESEYRVL